MVRLLTTNICNAYLTQIVLSIAGGFEDPRLFLPGWIGIATVRPHFPRTRDTNGFHRNYRTVLLTNYAVDSHRDVPHHSPKDQHSQGDVYIHQRLFHSQFP